MKFLARPLALILPAVILLALIAAPSFSEDNVDFGFDGDVGWSAKSKHSGSHPSECVGNDYGWVMYEDDDEYVVAEGVHEDLYLKKRLYAMNLTPLGGLSMASSTKRVHSGVTIYTKAVDLPIKAWTHYSIDDANGTIGAGYDGANILQANHIAAHTRFAPSDMVAMALGGGSDAIIADFFGGGIPAAVSGEIQLDSNGDIIWDTLPALQSRFTSSVSWVGTVMTFTYKIENFSPASRTFLFRDATTPQHPLGWAGIVAASSSESISYVVTGESLHRQTSQGSLQETDVGGDYEMPVEVLVPHSRVAFDGAVGAVSVANGAGVNVVTFDTVGPDDAGRALLYRTDSAGLHLVADVS